MRRRLAAFAILPIALGSASLPDPAVVYSSALPVNCALHRSLTRVVGGSLPLAVGVRITTER